MVTLAQAIARRAGKWSAFVRIESLGDSTGLYSFTSGPPNYAATDAHWRPYLTELPRTQTERVSPDGGTLEAGAFKFSLLDRGNFLTSLLRWDADPATTLSANMTAAAAVAAVRATPGSIAINAVIHIGSEAMIVTNVVGLNVSVTRGALGTMAATHSANDPVYVFPPRLEGRVVTLGIVPVDADSAAQELVIDQFSIQKVDFSPGWTGYAFSCVSRLMALLRTVGQIATGYYEVIRAEAADRVGTPNTLFLQGVRAGEAFGLWTTGGGAAFEDRYFLVDDKEILKGLPVYSGLSSQDPATGAWVHDNTFMVGVHQRGRVGTAQIQITWDRSAAGMKVTLPLVACTDDAIGSFRFSRTNSTDRTDGSWQQSDHFVDIMLCLMTSARTRTDGLELTNFVNGQPNWSCLEPGWGAGIPISRINVASFLAVKDRCPDWRFPAFVLNSPTKLNELFDKSFLKVLGAFVVTQNGLLTLVLPRMPFEGQSGPVFDHSVLLRDPTPKRTQPPRISGGYDPSAQIRAVRLRLKGPNGSEVTTLITVGDFAGQLAQRDSPQDTDGILDLAVDGVLANSSGVDAMLEELALRKIFRRIKPPLLLEVFTSLSTYLVTLGQLIQLTFSLGPNPRTGVRGWSNIVMTVLEREFNFDVTRDQPGFRYVILGYAQSAAIGQVAPSASVTAWNGGTTTATISDNRYTDTGAGSLGLPISDELEWLVGQRLIVLNPNGMRASPVPPAAGHYQTITAIGAHSITVDGNWGGLNPNGLVLALADFDYARAAEQTEYAALADATNRTVGTTQQGPFAFGEL